MKIREIKKICGREYDLQRNYEIYRQLIAVTDEMLCDVENRILNFNREKNPLQNIDDIMNMQAGNGKDAIGHSFYNTWPFGIPTDETYPRFLAVCRGEQRLGGGRDGGVLKKVTEQSKKIAEKYRDDDYARKTVLVLTDKWDAAIFKRYEKKLLDHALNDGIWYIFLLVTEYGYTQIPFLPNDRNALRKCQKENIEDDITLKDMLTLLDGNPVKYCVTKGPWQPRGDVEYTFDFAGLRWSKESVEAGRQEGRISKRARMLFLESTLWIADIARDIAPAVTRVLDSPSCKLHMYGKLIEWDYCSADVNGGERLAKLQESINQLIKACEKEA